MARIAALRHRERLAGAALLRQHARRSVSALRHRASSQGCSFHHAGNIDRVLHRREYGVAGMVKDISAPLRIRLIHTYMKIMKGRVGGGDARRKPNYYVILGCQPHRKSLKTCLLGSRRESYTLDLKEYGRKRKKI